MSRRDRGTGNPISLFAFQDIITSVSGIMLFIVLMLTLSMVKQPERLEDVENAVAVPHDEALSALEVERAALLETLREKREAVLAQLDTLQALQTTDYEQLALQITDLEADIERTALEIARLDAALNDTLEATNATGSKDDARQAIYTKLLIEHQKLKDALTLLKAQRRLQLIPDGSNGKRPILIQLAGETLAAKVLAKGQTAQSFASVRACMSWLGKRNPRLEYVVIVVKPSGLARLEALWKEVGEAGFDLGLEPLEEELEAVY